MQRIGRNFVSEMRIVVLVWDAGHLDRKMAEQSWEKINLELPPAVVDPCLLAFLSRSPAGGREEREPSRSLPEYPRW